MDILTRYVVFDKSFCSSLISKLFILKVIVAGVHLLKCVANAICVHVPHAIDREYNYLVSGIFATCTCIAVSAH